MRIIKLQPEQVLTTHDFPVHNEHILKMYFRMAVHNPALIPPTPSIHLSQGLPLLPETNATAENHNQAIKTYFQTHPEVEYFMLDGSHKTTALTLTHNPIHSIIIESNADIRKMLEMVQTGEIFGFCSPDTIEESILDLAKHQSKSTDFQTISSKTHKMIKEQVIPQYMIKHFHQQK